MFLMHEIIKARRISKERFPYMQNMFWCYVCNGEINNTKTSFFRAWSYYWQLVSWTRGCCHWPGLLKKQKYWQSYCSCSLCGSEIPKRVRLSKTRRRWFARWRFISVFLVFHRLHFKISVNKRLSTLCFWHLSIWSSSYRLPNVKTSHVFRWSLGLRQISKVLCSPEFRFSKIAWKMANRIIKR